jgi:hypothetical protein
MAARPVGVLDRVGARVHRRLHGEKNSLIRHPVGGGLPPGLPAQAVDSINRTQPIAGR